MPRGATPKTELGHAHPSLCQADPPSLNTTVGMFLIISLDKYNCPYYIYIMGTIRLFTLSNNTSSTRFILKDHPGLEHFRDFAQKKDVKRLNIEQYFHGLGRDYKDHIKMVYGPVFGMDDARNGFIYEHKTTGELLRVDENDIPTTYEPCLVIYGDLAGILKTDTTNIRKESVITSYDEMDRIQNQIVDHNRYTTIIRDEWIPDKSFLVIE